MTTSMTSARESRKSAQPFDVDLFRNKLKNWERKQITETWDMVNTKKRKLSERFSDMDKEDMELGEDYRDDLVYRFGKRQRDSSYYPLDDDEAEMEEVSPLTLPSPVTVYEPTSATPFQSQLQNTSYFDSEHHSSMEPDPMSVAMRRQLSGYSEASTQVDNEDDSWISPCPPLSRNSKFSSMSSSIASSMPDTPTNNEFDSEDGEASLETYMTDIEHSDALHLAHTASQDPLDLDLASMAPHERNLLAALAPERFEKAALIKRAFRQSDKVLDQMKRDHPVAQKKELMDIDMDMDDGEYDQVFGELMHV